MMEESEFMRQTSFIKKIAYAVPVGILAVLSAYLLKGDAWSMWTWYLLVMVIGMLAMPVTGMLFKNFSDRGWMFSKVFAITCAGMTEWWLVSIKLLKFNTVTCIGVTVVLAAICIYFYYRQNKRKVECLPLDNLKLVYWEEILFFAVFLMWTYLAGFHPAAYGNTEKFMDYGFMEAMMRSETLPATDMWYSDGSINYYYGGQYFAVFLTKITGTQVAITYNLMRTFVAALAAALPFSLVWQLVKDRMGKNVKGWKLSLPYITGFIAGMSLCIAGNMQYVIYAWIIPLIQRITGQEVSNYWFPNATRYIGYNPVNESDKTIHEFPCYSFVLGDLHAHVVNIIFVLLLLGLLYAYMQRMRDEEIPLGALKTKKGWLKELFQPHIFAVSILIGIYHLTNFWDFIIYFVVTGGAILFMNMVRMRESRKAGWIALLTIAEAFLILVISQIEVLPFLLQFKSMTAGVGIAQHHSLWYQLLVLWGLPFMLTIAFLVAVLGGKIKAGVLKSDRIVSEKAKTEEAAVEKKPRQYKLCVLLSSIELPDLFVILLGCCAMGLILIPELVYVRDIYESSSARANTMFKLTYQAYMMFAMVMAYAIWHLIFVCRKTFLKGIALFGLLCLLWTWGYFGNACDGWFGQYKDPSQYQGLNAEAFLESDFYEDAAAIRWLEENVEGSPVVLEANGDSYSNYERVSAMTGLPTVLGWYVHEWLWRSDVADINQRGADVQAIYTSTDEATVRELIEEYDIEYIFVGSCERQKYGETLNNTLLQSLGEVVFLDSAYDTYIVKVER